MGIAFGVIIILIGLIRLLVDSSNTTLLKAEKEEQDKIALVIASKKVNKELELKYKNEVAHRLEYGYIVPRGSFNALSPEVQKIREYYNAHIQKIEMECSLVLSLWKEATTQRAVRSSTVAELLLYIDGYYPECMAKLYASLKVLKNWDYYKKLGREYRKRGVTPNWE